MGFACSMTWTPPFISDECTSIILSDEDLTNGSEEKDCYGSQILAKAGQWKEWKKWLPCRTSKVGMDFSLVVGLFLQANMERGSFRHK